MNYTKADRITWKPLSSCKHGKHKETPHGLRWVMQSGSWWWHAMKNTTGKHLHRSCSRHDAGTIELRVDTKNEALLLHTDAHSHSYGFVDGWKRITSPRVIWCSCNYKTKGYPSSTLWKKGQTLLKSSSSFNIPEDINNNVRTELHY